MNCRCDLSNRPWLSLYDSGVPYEIKFPDITLVGVLDGAAEALPRHPAIDFYGKVLTYEKLWEAVGAFAEALIRAGVEKGDRVALLLPNTPQFIIGYYGILKAGAVVVPINLLLTGDECSAIVKDAGAKVLVGLDILMPKVSEAVEKGWLQKTFITSVADYLPPALRFLYRLKNRSKNSEYGRNAVSFLESVGLKKSADANSQLPKPDDLAALIYTSGTTGTPKGAMLTHRNLLANVLQCYNWMPEATKFGKEIFLGILPFFHAYGMTASMNLPIVFGALNVLLPKFSARETIRAIRRRRVSLMSAVPAMYVALLQHEAKLRRLKSLKTCISGAGSLKREVHEKFEALTGARVSEGYGLSEASPVTHINPIRGCRKIGSIGIPLPNTDARIADDGELLIRGPQVMAGYWNRPEETAEVLEDGWLKTGDIVKMDEDNFFIFADRKKDLIKVGGENVFPAEVESVVLKHPNVVKAAAVEAPDEFLGSHVKIFIVTAEGKEVSEREIIDFCGGKLAPFKIPKEVEAVTALPENFLGKVLRRKLKNV